MNNVVVAMKFHQLLFFLIFLSACAGEKNNFRVEGTIDGLENVTIYLYKRSITGTLPVDSAIINDKGSFVIQGFTGYPDFYILFFQKDRYVNLIIHPTDKIHISATAENFERDYFVEGSKDSRLIHKLVTKQAQTLDRITALSIEYENSLDRPDQSSIRARIDSLYDIVFREHKQYSIDFIRENKESLASLMALYQQLGRRSPVFDYKKDFRYFEQVDSALCILYPTSEAVKDLNKKVTQIREMLKVEIGSTVPDLKLPDINGKVVALSEFKGKLVLVNFWASWSDASVAANQSLLDLYKEYHPEGFEVLQVSLDRSRESWLQAIRDEKAGWIHISDLKYWDSPVVESFRIENIPSNYLIDRNGIITAKNIKSDELERILTEMLL
ncbi:MAG: AhpC/TSA family protein [Bacteroidales bacterium]|nr:AhpC/TSA family protein [Bacteroidales bacterium]MBN2761542.1 AhpC/TSA family protein [Bacteroidales bacterium]